MPITAAAVKILENVELDADGTGCILIVDPAAGMVDGFCCNACKDAVTPCSISISS